MNELITQSLVDENVSYLIEFPRELMHEHEITVVTWILKYYKKFGHTPLIPRLQRKFDFFIPIESPRGTPLEDVYNETLEAKMKAYVTSELAEMELIVRAGDPVPLDRMQKIMTLSSMTGGVLRFSTFDRDTYFRSEGIGTGFALIDRVTGGLSPGDYALIAGRLGAGKTTISQWIVYHWWQLGMRVLVVSNEMMPSDIFARLDGMVGSFNPLLLRTMAEDPAIMKGRLEAVQRTVRTSEGEILIPRARLQTPSQVAALAKTLDIDAVVIDGLYLMKPDGARGNAKWERVAEVSNQTKQMALDIGLPVLGVVQIKRVGDKEEFDPEDLAYSDALGQDSDFIIALQPNKLVPEKVTLSVIKNRFGPQIGCIARINYDRMEVIDESVIGSGDPATGGLW